MKKLKYVIYVFLIVVSIYLVLNFSKSNEQYIAEVEDEFVEILKPGINKKEIKKYLDKKSAIYNETLKENCQPWVRDSFKYECEFPGSLHTRVAVGSFINPVK